MSESDHRTLASTGLDIIGAFRELLESWTGSDGKVETSLDRDGVLYEDLLDQQERFDLWAVNTGMYHTGHASLDYRFRDIPNIYKYCENLLSDLRDLLKTLGQELNSKDSRLNSYSPSNDINRSRDANYDDEATAGTDYLDDEELNGYDDETTAQAALKGVADCVSRLLHLSMKLRVPSRRTGASRGHTYCQIDEDTGRDLYECFAQAEIDEKHIESILTSCRIQPELRASDHGLVKRLARANNHRRRQFGYWTQQKVDLIRRSEKAEKQEVRNIALPMPTTQKAVSQRSEAATNTFPDVRIVDLTDDTNSTDSNISIAESEFADSTSNLEFPAPPKLYTSQEREFECPYCYTLCSSSWLSGRKWKAHLIKDLRPYVCTYEECHDGDQLYDSFLDWLDHELTIHMPWQDQHVSSQDILHENFPPIQQRSMNDEASDMTRDCPFCLQQLEGIVPMYRHIASHLTRIALFALPRSTGVEVDEDCSMNSNDAVQSNLGSGSQNSKDSQLGSLSFMSEPERRRRHDPVQTSYTAEEAPTQKESPLLASRKSSSWKMTAPVRPEMASFLPRTYDFLPHIYDLLGDSFLQNSFPETELAILPRNRRKQGLERLGEIYPTQAKQESRQGLHEKEKVLVLDRPSTFSAAESLGPVISTPL